MYLPDRLVAALADRFEIERVVGRGADAALAGAVGLEGIQVLPAAAVAVAGSYVAYRGVFRALIGKRHRILNALLDRLSQRVTGASEGHTGAR